MQRDLKYDCVQQDRHDEGVRSQVRHSFLESDLASSADSVVLRGVDGREVV